MVLQGKVSFAISCKRKRAAFGSAFLAKGIWKEER
jgi:hypothetical protein